jgi:hypothetical protein
VAVARAHQHPDREAEGLHYSQGEEAGRTARVVASLARAPVVGGAQTPLLLAGAAARSGLERVALLRLVLVVRLLVRQRAAAAAVAAAAPVAPRLREGACCRQQGSGGSIRTLRGRLQQVRRIETAARVTPTLRCSQHHATHHNSPLAHACTLGGSRCSSAVSESAHWARW